MSSTPYRVFVCTKKRHPDDPEGCCCQQGAMEIYEQFQAEIQRHHLGDRVEIRPSGCLDRCEAGPVVLICQPKQAELSWLPLKARIKLRNLLFANKHLYGGFKVADVPSIIESHILKRKPLRKYQI
jgi:(2Fe-2S) ferredoxin